MRISLLLIIWIFTSVLFNELHSQLDSIEIEDIIILAKPLLVVSTGTVIESWDDSDLTNQHSLAELLQENTAVYIKSYGNGSLATSSIRGGNAGHTLVLWNDIPIVNPMLGLLDLSLIPIGVIDEISLQKGGNSTLWGSGAIGGAINLSQSASFENKYETEAYLSTGSFGLLQSEMQIRSSTEHFESKTSFTFNKANNNFSYFVSDDLPNKIQSNAELQQTNFVQDLYWKIDNKNRLSGHIWILQSDRQIPPTSVQNSSQAYQNDQAKRFLLDYDYSESQFDFEAKVSYLNEDINYYDPLQLIISESNFESIIGQFKGQYSFRKNHILSLGMLQNFTKASSAGYTSEPTEWRTAIIGSHRWNHKKWEFQTTLRQELVDLKIVPIIGSIGIQYKTKKAGSILAKVSKNYKLPTLNDRFWKVGGNVDLLPEAGWSQELSYVNNHAISNIIVKSITSIYNRNIDNWIMWIPQDNSPIYRPTNITNVWSRGVEQALGLTHQRKKLEWATEISYSYTRSNSTEHINSIGILAGEQLIYVPKHQLKCRIQAKRNQVQVLYTHQFTSATIGFNYNLRSYHVGRAYVAYDLTAWESNFKLFASVNNIWNTNYEVIERRPMMGRNFELGIKINIKK